MELLGHLELVLLTIIGKVSRGALLLQDTLWYRILIQVHLVDLSVVRMRRLGHVILYRHLYGIIGHFLVLKHGLQYVGVQNLAYFVLYHLVTLQRQVQTVSHGHHVHYLVRVVGNQFVGVQN